MTERPSLFSLRVVAALFVTKDGTYYGLPGVDPWDEERDARLYNGPYPVVAHPPCARWSRLAGFTEARFGYKRGEDGGCFAAALRAVRRCGGVIEHPAHSDAWTHYGLPRPTVREGWTRSLMDEGASCYVEQGRYGLPVKKATWLYAYGVELPDLRWGFTPDRTGAPLDGAEGLNVWRDRFGGRREQWEESHDKPRGPNGERRRASHLGLTSTTPPSFRDALIAMARTSHVTCEAVA